MKTIIGGKKALRPFNPKHFPIKEWLADQLSGKGTRPKATSSKRVTYDQLTSDFELSGLNSSYQMNSNSIKKALQSCVRELRMHNHMPISGTGPGLWLCETVDDIQMYYDSLHNRIEAQASLLKSVSKWMV